MKNKYEVPTIHTVEFSSENIITTSVTAASIAQQGIIAAFENMGKPESTTLNILEFNW